MKGLVAAIAAVVALTGTVGVAYGQYDYGSTVPGYGNYGQDYGQGYGQYDQSMPDYSQYAQGQGNYGQQSPHTSRGSTSRDKKGTIRDTAVIKAMDLHLHRNTIITRVTGQEEALQTLHISSNKHHRAAELDSLPNIKLLDRSSSVLL